MGKRERAAAGLAAAVGLFAAGCGKGGSADNPAAPGGEKPPLTASIPAPPPTAAAATDADHSMTAKPATPAAATPPTQPVSADAPAVDPKFAMKFEEAVCPDAPDGANLPPDRTIAGKPAAALHAAVVKAWPTVRVTDPAGNPSPILVTLDTAAGPVEIALRPDVAPNHVRNFLALAEAGYYGGLVFERVVRQEVQAADGSKSTIELVTAGCPLGEGTPGSGHIGYFLRPEPSDLKHEAGTVGFWRDSSPLSAGTRLYITLSPVPSMDGEFTVVGKVTGGLDVVRRIAAAPVKDPNGYPAPESEQPKEPVQIRAVVRK